MIRFAPAQRVYFVEEPVLDDIAQPTVSIQAAGGVFVVVPRVPRGYGDEQSLVAQRAILDQVMASERITRFVLWYYTPLALKFTAHLKPLATVYDCMDELAAFKNADPDCPALERRLMRRSDVVFTGGQSLYEAKKSQHANLHALPSSVDAPHFAQASWDRTWRKAAALLNAALEDRVDDGIVTYPTPGISLGV